MTVNECKAEILYYKCEAQRANNKRLKMYYEKKYQYYLQLYFDLSHSFQHNKKYVNLIDK